MAAIYGSAVVWLAFEMRYVPATCAAVALLFVAATARAQTVAETIREGRDHHRGFRRRHPAARQPRIHSVRHVEPATGNELTFGQDEAQVVEILEHPEHRASAILRLL